MAGGGSLGGGGRAKRGKASKRKAKKRVGFHLDMTPLVDITFLLLTFFMFTTTMATPQIMEMKLPPEIVDVPVDENLLFTLRVSPKGNIYWNIGDYKVNEPESIKISELKALVIREHMDDRLASILSPEGKVRGTNDLITALKVSEEAPYGFLVKVLDELNKAELEIAEKISSRIDETTGAPMKRSRKFTISPYTEEDEEVVNNLEGEGGN